MNTTAPDCRTHLANALTRAKQGETPYRHWLLHNVLPESTCAGLAALPLSPPPIGDTMGRRETHNDSRIFLNPDRRARFPVCATLADALQSPPLLTHIQWRYGVTLTGTFLRIEYCLDQGGFWLEPHTDILDGAHKLVTRVPAHCNSGLIFVPAENTWHGFAPRPITGIRRTLIVNYVVPEWRSGHELAFPDAPISA